jgi:hypothetical protein
MKSLCTENILHVLDLSPPSFWNSRSPLLQPPRDDTVNHAAARNRAGGGVLREHDDLGLIGLTVVIALHSTGEQKATINISLWCGRKIFTLLYKKCF